MRTLSLKGIRNAGKLASQITVQPHFFIPNVAHNKIGISLSLVGLNQLSIIQQNAATRQVINFVFSVDFLSFSKEYESL